MTLPVRDQARDADLEAGLAEGMDLRLEFASDRGGGALCFAVGPPQ